MFENLLVGWLDNRFFLFKQCTFKTTFLGKKDRWIFFGHPFAKIHENDDVFLLTSLESQDNQQINNRCFLQASYRNEEPDVPLHQPNPTHHEPKTTTFFHYCISLELHRFRLKNGQFKKIVNCLVVFVVHGSAPETFWNFVSVVTDSTDLVVE